jgi:hypothetical protein
MLTNDKIIMNTRLYLSLTKKEKEADNDITLLSSSIQNTNNNLSIILNRVCENMKEYTLHNILHCYNVLEIIADILPESVDLNLPELYILIQAVIFHDLGMAPSNEDVAKMKLDEEYENFLIHNDWLNDEEAICEYIRRNHVKNSCFYMERYSDLIVKFKDINIKKWINSVILSHGMSVSEIQKKTELFPTDLLIDKWSVNIRYLSLLLRLGDILDFDTSRTPSILYAHITPHNHVSKLEWEKHMSITGRRITPTSIRFGMNSNDVIIERKVRDFMESINKEITESIRCINESGLDNYKLTLKEKIDLQVYPEGYIYNDYEIEADYFGLSKILMGQQLYTNKEAFIRELLQNSIDACRVRKLDIEKIDGYFEPKITITYNSTSNIFSIEDNGCGIDEDIFKNYILKIGRSYYGSRRKDFEKRGISPINKFGIGLLSNFMVSNTITIESKRFIYNLKTSPIWFELNVNNTYVNQKNSTREEIGTKITLQLNTEFATMIKNNNLINLIQKYYFCNDYTINVIVDDVPYTIKNMLDEELKRREQYLFNYKIDLNDMAGINGAIYFKKNRSDYPILENIISYKGFKILNSSHTSILSFIYFSIVIDIDDPIQLDLNTSRENIILNDRWYNLTARLVHYIITKANDLNIPIENYIAIRYRAVKLRYFNEEQKILLWKTIKLELWNDNSWQEVDFYDFIYQIIKRTKNILIFKTDHTSYFEHLDKFLTDKEDEFTIIKSNNNMDLILLLHPFISYVRYCIFQDYEIIPVEISLKLVDNIDSFTYNETNNDKNLATISCEENESSIYLFLQLEESIFINAVINEKHPLANLSKLNKRNPTLQIFFESLKSNIINGFINDIKLDEFHIEEVNIFPDIWDRKSSLNKKGFITEKYIASANQYFKESVLPNITIEPGVDYNFSNTSFPKWYLE